MHPFALPISFLKKEFSFSIRMVTYGRAGTSNKNKIKLNEEKIL